MKKVEIEILSYGAESILSSTTSQTGSEYIYNYDFNNNPLGAVIQESDDGYSMKTNFGHATQNVWKGFWSDGTSTSWGWGVPEFAPFRNGSNNVEFSCCDSTGTAFALSSIYQKITGLTIGNTYSVDVDVASLPPGYTANDVQMSVGIWGDENNASVNCITQQNLVYICEVGVNAGNNVEGWGGGLSNPLLTTGVNSFSFVAQNTSGIFSLGVVANNNSLVGQSLEVQSVSLNNFGTTTTQDFQYVPTIFGCS